MKIKFIPYSQPFGINSIWDSTLEINDSLLKGLFVIDEIKIDEKESNVVLVQIVKKWYIHFRWQIRLK